MRVGCSGDSNERRENVLSHFNDHRLASGSSASSDGDFDPKSKRREKRQGTSRVITATTQASDDDVDDDETGGIGDGGRRHRSLHDRPAAAATAMCCRE